MDKYDHHFNEKLAEYAISEMKSREHELKHWTKQEVVDAWEKKGWIKPNEVTWCDVWYVCNMSRFDYMGTTITDDIVLLIAMRYINDIDGYCAKALSHYLTNVMSKGEPIDWSKMI